ncbi:MAG TPA: hypothetical protein VFR47_10795 [Anaerolineales bacterium]|nr:hypothetical protein [Anaerolineales bacterium]
MRQLGCIPTVGDTFEWHDFRPEMMDMDGPLVDKALVTPVLPRSSHH